MKVDTDELAEKLKVSREAYVQDLVRSDGSEYAKGKLAGAIVALDEVIAFLEGNDND